MAALYRATDRVSVWGSFSKGFRAPTLKELYSPFRVGQVLTLANETLGPERLIGEEARRQRRRDESRDGSRDRSSTIA